VPAYNLLLRTHRGDLVDTSLAGTLLTRDLVAADGRVVASRGEVVDLNALRDVAARAPAALALRPLAETSIADDVLEAFEAPPLQHLFDSARARAQTADALAEIRFPQEIWDELEELRSDDATRLQHAVWTAVVSARLFRAALGNARGLGRTLAGALVHDLGMRHAAPRLRHKRDHLSRAEALALEDHPLLGALLLASVLGDAPAVHLALLHHVRAGHGYPRVEAQTPLRGLDVLSVASAFAAMVASRNWRPQPYSPRGAIDQLLDEADAGHFDPRAVRLLIFCMRGAHGGLAGLRLPQQQTGFRPPVNHHGMLAAG
jgi:HD-GYP domain-containing protein (c-di-GMP phosphodiesterase class II)